ncbi:hypothetical protein OC842_005207 [Tilletia horrida]|uniref:Uncharacterized protein n=1 Tax=Tilletia horrida TaxID=155126 RepID=A0AAN6G8A0_9BASI|nr:hypothetical protein OC842_005207 [Tilletia horrida]
MPASAAPLNKTGYLPNHPYINNHFGQDAQLSSDTNALSTVALNDRGADQTFYHFSKEEILSTMEQLGMNQQTVASPESTGKNNIAMQGTQPEHQATAPLSAEEFASIAAYLALESNSVQATQSDFALDGYQSDETHDNLDEGLFSMFGGSAMSSPTFPKATSEASSAVSTATPQPLTSGSGTLTSETATHSSNIDSLRVNPESAVLHPNARTLATFGAKDGTASDADDMDMDAHSVSRQADEDQDGMSNEYDNDFISEDDNGAEDEDGNYADGENDDDTDTTSDGEYSDNEVDIDSNNEYDAKSPDLALLDPLPSTASERFIEEHKLRLRLAPRYKRIATENRGGIVRQKEPLAECPAICTAVVDLLNSEKGKPIYASRLLRRLVDTTKASPDLAQLLKKVQEEANDNGLSPSYYILAKTSAYVHLGYWADKTAPPSRRSTSWSAFKAEHAWNPTERPPPNNLGPLCFIADPDASFFATQQGSLWWQIRTQEFFCD